MNMAGMASVSQLDCMQHCTGAHPVHEPNIQVGAGGQSSELLFDERLLRAFCSTNLIRAVLPAGEQDRGVRVLLALRTHERAAELDATNARRAERAGRAATVPRHGRDLRVREMIVV
ncbi:unnamed protein product [Sphagnum balticum]